MKAEKNTAPVTLNLAGCQLQNTFLCEAAHSRRYSAVRSQNYVLIFSESIMGEMQMIGIYCRQSVDKKDSISIEQQRDTCVRVIGDAKYTVFSDKGYTGANTNRPGFEKMMKAVETGIIEKVIVYKVDRISRSLLDFVGIYSEFEKRRVEFVSCCEQFDTSNAMGKATLQIIMVFAELERNMIQKRVRDNFYERAKKGLYLAGAAPYGFQRKEIIIDGIHTHMLEPESEHPEKLSNVRWMYTDYRLNRSLGRIAKILNGKKALTNRGKPFTAVSVSRILRNTVYVRADVEVYKYLASKGAEMNQPVENYVGIFGCTVYGRRKGKTVRKFSDLRGENVQMNLHEGIITSSEWLAVQKELDRNKPLSRSGKSSSTWLTGLTKCRFCGKGVTVVGGQKNGRRYLSCGGKKEHSCQGRTACMTFDEIESAVKNSLIARIKGFEFSERGFTAEENELKIRLEKNKAEAEKLLDKVADAGESLMHYINERIEMLEAGSRNIMEELKKLHEQAGTEQDAEKIRQTLTEWNELSFNEKKLTAQAFIEKIVVGDGTIEIMYR